MKKLKLYIVIKHSRHLRAVEKCTKYLPAARVSVLHFSRVLKCPWCLITVCKQEQILPYARALRLTAQAQNAVLRNFAFLKY